MTRPSGRVIFCGHANPFRGSSWPGRPLAIFQAISCRLCASAPAAIAISVEFARNPILYNPQPNYGDLVSNTVLRAIYAAVVCPPLLASTAAGVRGFGVLVTLSMLLAFLFATYAFTSIWCYLAAVVSAYIAVMMFRLPSPVGVRALRDMHR